MRRFPLGFLGLLLGAACGTDNGYGDASQDDYHFVRDEWVLPGVNREVWLLVVDTADNEAAATLRRSFAEAVALPGGGPYEPDDDACPSSKGDPSHQDPMDVRVAILRPSLESDQRLTTPFENPGLARIGERDDFVAHDAFIQAVAEEIQSVPEGASRGYPAFETIADSLALLVGQRPAQSVTEVSQRQSLAIEASTFYTVFIATTQDDTSEGEVSDYDISPLVTSADSSTAYGAMRLAVAPDGTNVIPQAEWGDQMGRWAQMIQFYDFGGGGAYQPLIAEVEDSVEGLFDSWLQARVAPHCWTAAPVRHEDGSVECRIYVETLDVSPCANRLGMLEPRVSADSEERSARLEQLSSGVPYRVCELQQLTGSALSRCLEQPEAQNYASGFCYPEPSAACAAACPSARVPVSLRFLGGLDTASGSLRMIADCNLQESF